MKNKQTAVEWLIEQLEPAIALQSKIIQKYVEQAKQMEQEQIITAWNDGDYAYFYSKETGDYFANGEDYYNEKYGK